MIRLYLILVHVLILTGTISAQQPFIDSLKIKIQVTANDTTRLILLGKITNGYREINPDSAYRYGMLTQKIANKLKLKLEEGLAWSEGGYALMNMSNYPGALEAYLTSSAIEEDPGSEKITLSNEYPPFDEYSTRDIPVRWQRLSNLSRNYQDMAILYLISENYRKAKLYCQSSIPLAKEANNLRVLSIIYSTLGRTYLFLNDNDSALLCHKVSYDYAVKAKYFRYTGSIFLNMGRVHLTAGDTKTAKEFFLKALRESIY